MSSRLQWKQKRKRLWNYEYLVPEVNFHSSLTLQFLYSQGFFFFAEDEDEGVDDDDDDDDDDDGDDERNKSWLMATNLCLSASRKYLAFTLATCISEV